MGSSPARRFARGCSSMDGAGSILEAGNDALDRRHHLLLAGLRRWVGRTRRWQRAWAIDGGARIPAIMSDAVTIDDIQLAFEEVVPRKHDRKLILGQLMRSIGYCEALGCSAWAVSRLPNGFRLNVGQVEALSCEITVLTLRREHLTDLRRTHLTHHRDRVFVLRNRANQHG